MFIKLFFVAAFPFKFLISEGFFFSSFPPTSVTKSSQFSTISAISPSIRSKSLNFNIKPLLLLLFPIPLMGVAGSTSKVESPDLETTPRPKHIFILSGQSNMAGRGGVTRNRHWDGVVPPQCHPNPAVSRLSAALRWEPAREPLHHDIDSKKVCGVGPGMAFANAVVRRGGAGSEAVGLVPCAVGGTAIKEWARGENLYENMVRRARDSVKGSSAAAGGEIKALIWYQGESDTENQRDAEAYRANMERFIHNFRQDLGLPSLPIIQVAIASGDSRYIERVREAQLGIDLPNVVCVDAKGLPLKEDHLHLTTEAQVRLGLMLAEAYLNNFASMKASYRQPEV